MACGGPAGRYRRRTGSGTTLRCEVNHSPSARICSSRARAGSPLSCASSCRRTPHRNCVTAQHSGRRPTPSDRSLHGKAPTLTLSGLALGAARPPLKNSTAFRGFAHAGTDRACHSPVRAGVVPHSGDCGTAARPAAHLGAAPRSAVARLGLAGRSERADPDPSDQCDPKPPSEGTHLPLIAPQCQVMPAGGHRRHERCGPAPRQGRSEEAGAAPGRRAGNPRPAWRVQSTRRAGTPALAGSSTIGPCGASETPV